MKWQTLTLSTFIAATVPVEKAGDVNPVMEAVNELAASMDGTAKPSGEMKKFDVIDFDPENPPIPDVAPGTFERFMGSMGNPAKWAGR